MGTPEGHRESGRERHSERWREEGRKEVGIGKNRRRDRRGRGPIIIHREHPTCHLKRCSLLGTLEFLNLRILEQWKLRRPKSENQRTLES